MRLDGDDDDILDGNDDDDDGDGRTSDPAHGQLVEGAGISLAAIIAAVGRRRRLRAAE